MTTPPTPSLSLRAIRGFHVGGQIVHLDGQARLEMQTITGNPLRTIDPNGHYAVGQLYAQHFEQAVPTLPHPLHLWHGGGLTGACWEDTPDGRPGWALWFLRHGFDLILPDASERGRASWAPYPEINEEAPWHRTLDHAWSMFRIGPEGGYDPAPRKRIAYQGSQFPVDAAEQLLRQFVPRWGSRQSDAWAESAYEALLERIGPSVVIAHSQGGLYAMKVAVRRPELFKAIIALEPVFPLDLGKGAMALASVPILVVLGDNLPTTPSLRAQNFLSAMSVTKARLEVLSLPRIGICGNSHMLMMDRNSDQIAGLVQDWIGTI